MDHIDCVRIVGLSPARLCKVLKVLTGDMVYSPNRNPGYAKAPDILPQS